MDPFTWIGAASSVIPSITGGRAGPAGPSRAGDIANNLLWSSPFLVGGTGNVADTSATQTPRIGGSQSGQQGGSSIPTASEWFPVLALVAGVVVVVSVMRGR